MKIQEPESKGKDNETQDCQSKDSGLENSDLESTNATVPKKQAKTEKCKEQEAAFGESKNNSLGYNINLRRTPYTRKPTFNKPPRFVWRNAYYNLRAEYRIPCPWE